MTCHVPAFPADVEGVIGVVDRDPGRFVGQRNARWLPAHPLMLDPSQTDAVDDRHALIRPDVDGVGRLVDGDGKGSRTRRDGAEGPGTSLRRLGIAGSCVQDRHHAGVRVGDVDGVRHRIKGEEFGPPGHRHERHGRRAAAWSVTLQVLMFTTASVFDPPFTTYRVAVAGSATTPMGSSPPVETLRGSLHPEAVVALQDASPNMERLLALPLATYTVWWTGSMAMPVGNPPTATSGALFAEADARARGRCGAGQCQSERQSNDERSCRRARKDAPSGDEDGPSLAASVGGAERLGGDVLGFAQALEDLPHHRF